MFSFGVSAYEICTFNLPWERGTDGRAAMTHSMQPPVEIQRYRPQINPVLGKAIMRASSSGPIGAALRWTLSCN